MPERMVHLEELEREYDRLAVMLDEARPASGHAGDMLAATAAMRQVLDNARLLMETVAVETYDQTTASHTDIGVALGTLGRGSDRDKAMARNNAQRWLVTAREKLPAQREAEGLPARLGA